MTDILIAKLNALASLSLILLAASAFIMKKKDSIRIIYGFMTLTLGLAYSFRTISERTVESVAYNIEHFFLTLCMFSILIFFEKIGKLKLSIKFKLYISILFLILIIGTATSFHTTIYWLVLSFIYQLSIFTYLYVLNFKGLRSAKSSFEKRRYSGSLIAMACAVIILLIDWTLSKNYFSTRPSALLIFPIIFIITAMINNSHSFSKKSMLLGSFFTIVKIMGFSYALYFLIPKADWSIFTFIVIAAFLIELTFKSIFSNISRIYRFDIKGATKELINFKEEKNVDRLSFVKRTRYISVKELDENKFLHFQQFLKEKAPVLSVDLLDSPLSQDELSISIDLKIEIDKAFKFYKCHVFYYIDDETILTVEVYPSENIDEMSLCFGKITALIIGDSNVNR
jgi:hypothetical protein